LRTDEKHIRAQSTILDKTHPKPVVAFFHNRVFGTDTLFIRTKNTVGARSAQSPLLKNAGSCNAAYARCDLTAN